METINERLKFFIEEIVKPKSLRAFDLHIGVSETHTNNIIGQKQNIPNGIYFQKLKEKYPSLSLNWLISGIGSIYQIDPIITTYSYSATDFNKTFIEAYNALNENKRVTRSSNCFIFKQIPSVIPYHFIPQMKSLPQSVKDEFERRGADITYSDQLAIVYDDNRIVGYSPSVEDINATDWRILD